MVNACRITLLACLIVFAITLIAFPITSSSASAQRKSKSKPAPVNELTKLREEFVKTSNEYKSSLEKLIAIYETGVKKAEAKLDQSKKLFEEGLISRVQLEENERLVASEQEKLKNAQRQMTEADAQIAAIMVESEAEKTIAKNLRFARQTLVRTAAFTRYAGSSGFALGDAWKIQRFFSESFKKELPIAVFGQGAIHDRWRLDHRNALDISLHPDSAEGQVLLNFLQQNGIPYLAFRSAIPGTATGPHIHIGRPSHRY